ncbi:MAG TPA: hypothetical protein DCQ31_04190 [Bacteroidales bacterium]|nr:hypothetical protein [Bacteroidales bacterium]
MNSLRDRAEERLNFSKKEISELSNIELQKLVEELRIHQIELEIQNEELIDSRNENEKAREKYFNLFDLAPVAYVVINKTGIIQELNLKAAELFVRRKLHLLGHPFVSLLDTESMSKFYEYFEYAQSKRFNEIFTLEIQQKYQIKHIELSISNFPEEMYLLAIMDITERVIAENALKAGAKQLKEITDNIPVFIAQVDKHLNYLFVNKMYEDFFNISASDMIGTSIKGILSELYTREIETHIANALQGEVVCYESKYLTKNNEILFFDVKLVPHFFDGEVVGYFSLIVDITERKKIEKALAESELRFRSYISTSPLPIFVVNELGEYKFVNHATSKLVGYSQEELLSFKFNELTFDYNRDQAYYAFTQMVEHGSNKSQIDLKHKNGKAITIILDSIKISDTEFIGFCTNISKIKETEIALKEKQVQLNLLNDTKNRLLSILAHDLKSPFNGIMGFSNLLLTNIHHYDKEKAYNFALQINMQAKSTFTLLENLLDWVRNQSDGISINPTNNEISSMVFVLIDFYNPLASIKRITIQNFVPPDLIVFADTNMLNTVLRNLLGNAIKYAKTGGIISIYAEKNTNETDIKITDNGIGMSEETLANLFNNTRKVSVPGTAGESGTGLGLALCKDFIEKHNGVLEVKSTLHVGSEFIIKLPSPKA